MFPWRPFCLLPLGFDDHLFGLQVLRTHVQVHVQAHAQVYVQSHVQVYVYVHVYAPVYVHVHTPRVVGMLIWRPFLPFAFRIRDDSFFCLQVLRTLVQVHVHALVHADVHVQVVDWIFCVVSGLECGCPGAEGGGGGPGGGRMAEECLLAG